jgi:hypothetical protein
VRPVLEQTRSHPAVPEPTAELGWSPAGDEHDFRVAQLEVDFVTRV